MLNYTIFVLLDAIINKEKKNEDEICSGDLDYCLDLVIPHLIEEISGIVQEEKDAEDYKEKIMEIKKSKVNACFFMLAKIIDFENNV